MIELNEVEKRLVTHLVERKVAYYETHHPERITMYRKGYKDMTPEQRKAEYKASMLQSHGAEMAFCKAMNVFPCLDHEDERGFDALVSGRRVDVKHTTYEHGVMAIKIKPGVKPPDLFALVIGTFPRYRLVGFIEAAWALRKENIDEKMPQRCYAIPQRSLAPFEACVSTAPAATPPQEGLS